MCGLVGGAGELNISKHRDAIQTMLILDVLRGAHSTGVAFINKEGDFTTVKRAGVPHDLIDSGEYDKAFKKWDTWAMIGHNRYATKGAINKVNAHPFSFDTTVGAHNGTIRNVTNLLDYKDFEVDSENVIWNIENEGFKPTLSKLQGAFALSVFDSVEGELHLTRNRERPLHLCYTKDFKTVFWASEAWMLTVALSRNKVEHTPIEELEVNSINTYRRQGGLLTLLEDKFEPYRFQTVTQQKKEEEKKSYPLVTVSVIGLKTSEYGSEYIEVEIEDSEPSEGRMYTTGHQAYRDLALRSPCKLSVEVRSIINIKGTKPYQILKLETIKEIEHCEDDADEYKFYAHPNGTILTQEEWDKLKETGCGWCTSPITDEDEEDLGVYLGSVVCPSCKKDLECGYEYEVANRC